MSEFHTRGGRGLQRMPSRDLTPPPPEPAGLRRLRHQSRPGSPPTSPWRSGKVRLGRAFLCPFRPAGEPGPAAARCARRPPAGEPARGTRRPGSRRPPGSPARSAREPPPGVLVARQPGSPPGEPAARGGTPPAGEPGPARPGSRRPVCPPPAGRGARPKKTETEPKLLWLVTGFSPSPGSFRPRFPARAYAHIKEGRFRVKKVSKPA